MIGLGTYAFFWQHSDRVERPLSLRGALEATRELGVDLFQICDFAPLEAATTAQATEQARCAADLGIRIQLGTRGIAPEHLLRFLKLAETFDSTLVRSMLFGPDSRPSLAEAEEQLRAVIPHYEAAGVTLTLETYEQVATQDLVALVESIDSAHLRLCLDPANVVARLETPKSCVEAAAHYTGNVHVKDFAFAREPGWVGFTYGGAAMGEGLHDYRHLLDTVRPRQRGIDEIVEHWLPWQGDAESTVRAEQAWTKQTIDYLRSME